MIKKIIHGKHYEQCLEHNKFSKSIAVVIISWNIKVITVIVGFLKLPVFRVSANSRIVIVNVTISH